MRTHRAVDPTDHVLGPPNAPITLVEYGDFECPFCRIASSAIRIVLARYPEQVRFVFRHYPMTEVHPHAELAAESAEAAGAQGSFWPMHDLLFGSSPHLKDRTLRQHAEALRLDLHRFDGELADHVYLQRVQEHRASGSAAGVRGTPAFFLDGELLDASFGIDRVAEMIDRSAARSAARDHRGTAPRH